MNETNSYPMAERAKDVAGIGSRKLDITLRENIDGQIVQAEKRLQELKDAKARLEASAIIDMRIDDIQAAMRW